MSINSWKKEFYKGRLREAARTPLAATEHSLKKWEGLRDKNLKKHGLVLCDGDLYNPTTDTYYHIGADNCALCKRIENKHGYLDCSECPLRKSSGYECHPVGSGWKKWVDDGDPSLMIKQLKQTIKWVKEHPNDA